ncbi:MAG: DNA polymerase III subunit alpha, partial [Deltaproteobacteria bacterium]|nr:DNA polymerase III subunit alpha [Deltaproteobacteria bacterium]
MARLTHGAEDTSYVELHTHSAFSFFDGSATPEALVRRASELGLSSVALTDRDDLGGVVRFASSCEDAGVVPIVGAEVSLDGHGCVVLLAQDACGYRNLSGLITRGRMQSERGLPSVGLHALDAHHGGLVCLSGGREGRLEWLRDRRGARASFELAGQLAEIFEGAFYLELNDHGLNEDVRRAQDTLALARRLDLPWLVTGDVRYARADDKAIHDALICIAQQTSLPEAGDRLFPSAGRRLRSAREMRQLFRHAPEGVTRTLEVAERCRFRLLEDLRPGLPRFPLPRGVKDGDALLRALVEEGLRRRYPKTTTRHRAQVEHELTTIRHLELAGYFLIVHDIVRFARSVDVLVQGRGSAANSVVCYCLGITSVDPIGLDLLFERFLSEGRSEPPDIDLDIAHQRREEVLQYVYDRYGRDHAAMVAETITYRAKSAVRDAARVVGLPLDVANRLAKEVGHRVATDARSPGAKSAADRLMRTGLARVGLDARAPRVAAMLRIVRGLEGLPRHRSIHVGGFVLTSEHLGSVVPIEPASMPGRSVIQWDKDDLAPVGLVKIDLLGLGMLTLLQKAFARAKQTRGLTLALHTLPADDPETYAMIRAADTVGCFQIESRAQMSALPRNAPTRFYDLVVQVALIRPGPIQGEMVHPYLERRRGREAVSYLHPVLEPALKRTLGVPLFQEQGMRVAVVAAGFSPSQADGLRRAMGMRRSSDRMESLARELEQGMQARGIEASVAKRIVKQLAAFSSYGFPESHAASFALLVYASAYLKRHFAPEFYAALLDAQPMGFYSVGSIVADAKRHQVEVRPPDVALGDWESRLEPIADGAHPHALRLGLGLITSLGARARERIEAACAQGAFVSIEDFARRSELPRHLLTALARAGALDSLLPQDAPRDRRRALWEVLRVARTPAGPFDQRRPDAP